MMNPMVSILMESPHDFEIMQHAELTLSVLGIQNEVKVLSAHRTPNLLFDYCKLLQPRGVQVIIAGSSDAAHLPGMIASLTLLPVLGVPIPRSHLQGIDSLLSMVQMSAGSPVGCLALGRNGAINAALLAAQILALKDSTVGDRIAEYREAQSKKIRDNPDPR